MKSPRTGTNYDHGSRSTRGSSGRHDETRRVLNNPSRRRASFSLPDPSVVAPVVQQPRSSSSSAHSITLLSAAVQAQMAQQARLSMYHQATLQDMRIGRTGRGTATRGGSGAMMNAPPPRSSVDVVDDTVAIIDDVLDILDGSLFDEVPK